MKCLVHRRSKIHKRLLSKSLYKFLLCRERIIGDIFSVLMIAMKLSAEKSLINIMNMFQLSSTLTLRWINFEQSIDMPFEFVPKGYDKIY